MNFSGPQFRRRRPHRHDPAPTADGSVPAGHQVSSFVSGYQLDSAAADSKQKERDDEIDSSECADRISNLPDDILVKIVSLLSFQEAVRTSILCSRWINVWKSAELVLDFDASKLLRGAEPPKQRYEYEARESLEQRRYRNNWVIGVVRQLWTTASKVKGLKTTFLFEEGFNSEVDLDALLVFAILKRVESLELRLSSISSRYCYAFSEECFNYMKTLMGISNIKHLRCLRLSQIKVKGEVLEHFIANCPLLEELSVEKSYEVLVTLRIVGAASASSSPISLKRLELIGCSSLKLLEIDNAPNLTQFLFDMNGPGCQLLVKNCASLMDVTFFQFQIDAAFRFLSCCLGQLNSLTLETPGIPMPYVWEYPDMAALTKLRLLTVKNVATDKMNILQLIDVINHLPSLHTLRLLMEPFDPKIFGVTRRTEVLLWAVEVYQESIRVVEITGFQGCTVECEFLEHVLQFFVGVERIVIEVDRGLTGISYRGAYRSKCHHRSISNYCDHCRDELVERAERVALEFKSRAAPTVEVVVNLSST